MCFARKFGLLLGLWAVIVFNGALADFEKTQTGAIDTAGAKDGGVAWGDFNKDGCLDALVNTNADTQLYQQDSASRDCAGTFSQVKSFTDVIGGTNGARSVAWGDYNNDGRTDFAVNSREKIAIYRNTDGTPAGFASPAFQLNTFNSEGIAWIDYDKDNDLDLLIENQQGQATPSEEGGIRIFINNAGSFDSANVLDLVGTGSTAGDYLTATDIDGDGDVDFYARRDGANDTDIEADLFINNGDATFTRSNQINEDAPNGNKGGAVFCDLDNDGDFDFARTGGGPTQTYEQTTLGVFTALASSPGAGGDFDSVACADVDNDGDEDLFFTSNAGDDELHLNNGDLTFTPNNLSITGNGDGEGAAFADYDRDGDMDLLINQDGAANELWKNKQDDPNYLQVKLTTDGRNAIGATVQLLSCSEASKSGIKEINGGMGHGSQAAPLAHFGLGGSVGGPAEAYIVHAKFVGGATRSKAVVPNTLTGYQLVTLDRSESDDLGACQDSGTDIDTDGDGVPDRLDLDSDNDGIPDIQESGADGTMLDVNADGRIDTASFGVGSNGLADAVETTVDSGASDYNGDGAVDIQDDTDSDTVPDFQDIDSDNDALPDVLEAGGVDLVPSPDGRIDGFTDADGDGWDDTIASSSLADTDSDLDGQPDRHELDSDNDGVTDIAEAGGTDGDGDGLVDGFTDANGDGLDDTVAAAPLTPLDTDGDGLPDNQDSDDIDADGIKDEGDVDDDNDGIPDIIEGNIDTDDDSITDERDLDSDNDGIPDLAESGADAITLDTDKNGRIDVTTFGVGSNGLADTIETAADSGLADYDADSVEDTQTDTDSDRVPDFLDVDSDNDGLTDSTEAAGADTDRDGRIDSFRDGNKDGLNDGTQRVPLAIPDTDADGVVDYRDHDSDNDGIPDPVEGGGVDDDGDGIIDAYQDTDVDGIPDAVDTDQTSGNDVDSDGIDDTADSDQTASADADNDGIDDGFDPDAEGDGMADALQTGNGGTPLAVPDTDTDGTPDYQDLDSDDDGLRDIAEAGGVDTDNDGKVDNFTDTDGDGLDDSLQSRLGGTPLTLPDSDGDGILNFQDSGKEPQKLLTGLDGWGGARWAQIPALILYYPSCL